MPPDVLCSEVMKCHLASGRVWAELVIVITMVMIVGVSDNNDRGSITARCRIFFLRHRSQTDSRAHSASYPMGTEGSFPGVTWLGREANH